ncbi:MAG: TetR family transcriptional regulator, partial [Acidimicrobiales bacterium]
MANRTDPSSPPRSPLSPARLFGTAVTLADRDGLGAVTMRKLAAELDVEAMSLYHHVANKDEILDGMVDAVFAEIDLPSPEAAWKPALRRRAISVRQVLHIHPWATALMESRP